MSDAFEAAMQRMRNAMDRGTGCALTAEMVQAVTRAPKTPYRVMLRELMQAALSVQDFWVSNWITGRLSDDDYESFVPHIFSPTEFGGDDCRICGCDLRSARHVRAAPPAEADDAH